MTRIEFRNKLAHHDRYC